MSSCLERLQGLAPKGRSEENQAETRVRGNAVNAVSAGPWDQSEADAELAGVEALAGRALTPRSRISSSSRSRMSASATRCCSRRGTPCGSC